MECLFADRGDGSFRSGKKPRTLMVRGWEGTDERRLKA